MKKLLLTTLFMLIGSVSVSMAQSPATVPKPVKKKPVPEEREATVKGKSDADFKKTPGAVVKTDSQRLKEKELIGKWKSTKVFYDGKQINIEGKFIPEEIKFTDDGKFTMQTGEKEFYGTYELDTTKAPMWITIKYDDETEKPFQGSLFRDVFKINGNKLTIVTNVQKRPEKLSSTEKSLNTLIEFERIIKDIN